MPARSVIPASSMMTSWPGREPPLGGVTGEGFGVDAAGLVQQFGDVLRPGAGGGGQLVGRRLRQRQAQHLAPVGLPRGDQAAMVVVLPVPAGPTTTFTSAGRAQHPAHRRGLIGRSTRPAAAAMAASIRSVGTGVAVLDWQRATRYCSSQIAERVAYRSVMCTW